MAEVSLFRLYLMRVVYLLIFVAVGTMALPPLLNQPEPITPMRGVALSFWMALSLLALVGVRYPLRMIPVLLIQMLYKIIWLLALAWPLWRSGTAFDPDMAEFTRAMAIGIVVDVIAIPWGYVLANYVRRPGDRWTERGREPPVGEVDRH
ncbi:MAG TPA: hypothetical protein VFU20_03365 [Sphingomicrobium sp.]|nr:hypothetical protein [Sphingomicrobium sp.]